MRASLHVSPMFAARRLKGATWLVFATEERAGVLDSTSSILTERTSDKVRHWVAAAEDW